MAAAAVLATLGVVLVSVRAGRPIPEAAVPTFLITTLSFGALLTAVRLWAPSSTRLLIPSVTVLMATGLVGVERISSDLGALQRSWVVVGTVIAITVLFALRNHRGGTLRRYRYLFLAAAVGLLLLPLLPTNLPLGGDTIRGSRLWVHLELGSNTIRFQPGELAKVFLVAFLASYLADRRLALTEGLRQIGPVRIPEPRQMVPLLLAFGLAFAVLTYQRDLGASLLLFGLFIAMLYAATGRPTYLAVGGVLAGAGGYAAFRLFDHVQRRVDSWLRPFDDFEGAGYQVAQSLFAMGSGEIVGPGLGAGRPELIPAAATDYVFAVLAEEGGLLLGLGIIAGFAIVVGVGLGIALHARDDFRKLLATGLTLVLGIQTFLILAGVLRVLPLTGITLPFMSYGGSSLLANLLIVALLARISHEERA